MTNTKICKKCKNDLPMQNFYKNAKEPDGLEGNCKGCRNGTKMSVAKRLTPPKPIITSRPEKPLMEQLRALNPYGYFSMSWHGHISMYSLKMNTPQFCAEARYPDDLFRQAIIKMEKFKNTTEEKKKKEKEEEKPKYPDFWA